MKRLNYNEAYNKIIDAYFKDEIKPNNTNFCFCGTLSPDKYWGDEEFFATMPADLVHADSYPYTRDEYKAMEKALFSAFKGSGLERTGFKSSEIFPKDPIKHMAFLIRKYVSAEDRDKLLAEAIPDYEDRLFKGMSAALGVLKEIHRGRGENVDEELKPFVKRKLETV